jgi:hypothetical protein
LTMSEIDIPLPPQLANECDLTRKPSPHELRNSNYFSVFLNRNQLSRMLRRNPLRPRGSKAPFLASSVDGPLCPPLRASCCAAAKRRSGPLSAMCSAAKVYLDCLDGRGAKGSIHSALMPAVRMILPHFRVCSAMRLPNSAGVLAYGSSPNSASLALNVASTRAAFTC